MLTSEQRDFVAGLFDITYGAMFTYASTALDDTFLAEEAVQNSYRIGCIKIDELRASDNPAGWLMNTLKFTVRNKRREILRRGLEISIEEILEYPDSADKSLAENETKFMLYEDDHSNIFLEQVLNNNEHEIIRKIIYEKCTVNELAKEKGVTYEAFKTRYRRAKEKLKNAILYDD